MNKKTLAKVVYAALLAMGIVFLVNTNYPTQMYQTADPEFRFLVAYLIPIAVMSMIIGIGVSLATKTSVSFLFGGITTLCIAGIMWILIWTSYIWYNPVLGKTLDHIRSEVFYTWKTYTS